MDFLAIIRSLEELLDELVSWLIFYPEAAVGLHAPHSDNLAAKVIVGSAQNPLLLPAVLFSTIPLFIAVRALARNGRVIDRTTLRAIGPGIFADRDRLSPARP